MSIFGKKPDSAPQTSPSPQKAPPPPRSKRRGPRSDAKRSFLGPGCEFDGDFRGDGSLECSGLLNGTIETREDVLIGNGGTVTATLSARRIVIDGRLEGNATGAEKVEVGATGHVEGDVRAPAVQFADGAFFEGNVEMRRSKKQAEAASKEAAKAQADDGAPDTGKPEELATQ